MSEGRVHPEARARFATSAKELCSRRGGEKRWARFGTARRLPVAAGVLTASIGLPVGVVGQVEQNAQGDRDASICAALPSHEVLTSSLRAVVTPGEPRTNGGLGNHVWAVVVGREGTVCAVARSGETFDEQWLGSRGIASSKAHTANAFSLPGFALSSANLYWPSQPDSSLFGLESSSPADPAALHEGPAPRWGSADDPLVGRRIGGITVFAGGLALYAAEGRLVGALGVSGDESCTDHVIAWKIRHALNLDNVPNGVARDSSDNIIHDVTVDPSTGSKTSASGYGHPTCSPTAQTIAEAFTTTAPIGPEE